MTRVRFPSPAPTFAPSALRSASRACAGLNRSGLVTDFSDGRRGLALASTKGHEKFSRGATAPPRSVAQWLEHRSPKQADLLAKSTLVLKIPWNCASVRSIRCAALQNAMSFALPALSGLVGVRRYLGSTTGRPKNRAEAPLVFAGKGEGWRRKTRPWRPQHGSTF
jgi:hypothetical protein